MRDLELEIAVLKNQIVNLQRALATKREVIQNLLDLVEVYEKNMGL